MLENFVQEEYKEYIDNFKNDDFVKKDVKFEHNKSIFGKLFTRVSSPSIFETTKITSPAMAKKKNLKTRFSQYLKPTPTPEANLVALKELEISKLKEIIQNMKDRKNESTPEEKKIQEEKINETPVYDYLKKLEGDVSPTSIVLDDIVSNKNTNCQEIIKWNYYFPSLELLQTENLKIVLLKSNSNLSEDVPGLIELQINITNINNEQISQSQIILKNSGSNNIIFIHHLIN